MNGTRVIASGRLAFQPGVVRYESPAAAATGLHRAPVWKLVLGHDGPLRVTAGGATWEAPGVLTAPETENAVVAASAFTCVLIEPQLLTAAPEVGALAVPSPLADRLLGAAAPPDVVDWSATALGAPSSLHRATVPLDVAAWLAPALDALAVGPRHPPRRELERAAELLRAGADLPAIAEDVALSPSALRRLVRGHWGVTLVRLRRWQALADAAAHQAGDLASRAHSSGFSDQSHLTRVTRDMTGRTPGGLRLG